jgi:predicted secreted protein
VTPTDNAASIALQTDQQLIVKLPMQLGTGFSWRVDPKSARILAALKPSENSTESPPGAVSQPGAPEIQVLTFRAMMEGRGTLKLIYNQPWRVGVPPSKVFLLHITVHGARAAD